VQGRDGPTCSLPEGPADGRRQPVTAGTRRGRRGRRARYPPRAAGTAHHLNVLGGGAAPRLAKDLSGVAGTSRCRTSMELRGVQTGPIPPGAGMPPAFRVMMSAPWPAPPAVGQTHPRRGAGATPPGRVPLWCEASFCVPGSGMRRARPRSWDVRFAPFFREPCSGVNASSGAVCPSWAVTADIRGDRRPRPAPPRRATVRPQPDAATPRTMSNPCRPVRPGSRCAAEVGSLPGRFAIPAGAQWIGAGLADPSRALVTDRRG
jgi:hypothetical protein